MLTTKEVRGVRVCRPNRPGKEYTKDGMPRHKRKIGKIYKTVFSPDGLRVVGFIVRRPDLLWMIKRPERFLAIDAYDIQDGLIVPSKGADSWDERAIKRLGVDWDTCILWEGIQVKTPDGTDIGHVDEISFDEETGELNSLFLDDGGTARALIGSIEIPHNLMIGYKKGVLLVQPEAAKLLPSGGLAAKAGTATAQMSQGVKKGAQQAGKTVGKAVDKGSYGLGKLIGRAKGAVTGARDEFKRETGGSAQKAAGTSKAAASGAKPASTGVKASAAKASGTGKAATTAKASGTAKAATSTKTAAAKGAASTKTSAIKTSTTKASTAKASTAKTVTKAASSSKASSAKKASSTAAKSAGKAVSDHLKSAGSMFSDFKKEFDKANK